jgi:type IV pilus assembly protein PilB
MKIAESRIVDWIDEIIFDAITTAASDIHFEPFENFCRVRLRKNGNLFEVHTVSSECSDQIVARLQVLARIDTTQKRIPHDGKFIVQFQDRYIDIRVSTFPVLYGQKVVLRILDTALHNITLGQIGLELPMLNLLVSMLEKKNGLILVTGPTGSGKTTTLYAGLRHLNTSGLNIVTLEDPVEYSLAGIVQSPIAPDIGFTFAQGIRSILRQDPDVIMVGEIRDLQTARAAIEAALTGHLVLSTLHTVDAPSAIIRLMDMGIEPYLLKGTLLGIIGQRLVKQLCSFCICTVNLTEIEREAANLYTFDMVGKAVGCSLCNMTGYVGRLGLFELLVCNESLKSVISHNLSLQLLQEIALRNGWVSLIIDAQKKLQAHLIDYKQYYSILGN